MLKLGLKIKGERLDNSLESFLAALDMVRSKNLSCIEIVPQEFDLIIAGNLDVYRTKELAKVLRDSGVSHSVHVPLRLNLMNRDYPKIHKNVFQATLEICEITESKLLVFHPGRYVDNVDFARYGKPKVSPSRKREMIERENEIISQYALQFPQITIALENHRPYADYSPYSYAESVVELVDEVKKINLANVKVCIDTGHLNLAATYYGYSIFEMLEYAKDYIAHLHIHDNHGMVNFYTDKDKESMLPFGIGDEHLVPGEGTFPFELFFDIVGNLPVMGILELTSRYQYSQRIDKAIYSILNNIEMKNLQSID